MAEKASTVKSFEKNMARLEQIVAALEKGEAPLDESLALFEEGTALVRGCGKVLDEAERKIRRLTGTEGEPETEDFPEEEQ